MTTTEITKAVKRIEELFETPTTDPEYLWSLLKQLYFKGYEDGATDMSNRIP